MAYTELTENFSEDLEFQQSKKYRKSENQENFNE